MRIVILEDVPTQMEWLVTEVQQKLDGVVIEQITTEHHFLQRLPSFQANPPDAFILDIMVRWTDPGKNMPEPPPDVQAEKYYRAGIRCMQKVRAAGIDVRIILYSILENSDLQDDLAKLDAHTEYMPKMYNSAPLIKALSRK